MWKHINNSKSNKRVRGPTEQVARRYREENAKLYDYPTPGFHESIEHSLLYSMIYEGPTLFPSSVVEEHVQQEDFEPYLYVQSEKDENENEKPVSYAQLTAIVGLAADKWPVSSSSSSSEQSQQQQQQSGGIPQILCRRVLQTVVRYAERHDLDRESEVRELLEPLERQAELRSGKDTLRVILPYYVGLAASVVTANPLPMIVGSYATMGVAFGSMGKSAEDQKKRAQLQLETNRMADVEKASLLEEVEE